MPAPCHALHWRQGCTAMPHGTSPRYRLGSDSYHLIPQRSALLAGHTAVLLALECARLGAVTLSSCSAVALIGAPGPVQGPACCLLLCTTEEALLSVPVHVHWKRLQGFLPPVRTQTAETKACWACRHL
ncbi:hypothetical protein NDU88_001859 [Pleurodeles waltl]|uniref:Uncharacterized protein n=1 Tax=Pleurodeles waltl TaxID=8319 RepID=A0AAV7P6Q3_PLEWA|nr:hypothetical protein NDU88_001859 [Pleurodeles waltl]